MAMASEVCGCRPLKVLRKDSFPSCRGSGYSPALSGQAAATSLSCSPACSSAPVLALFCGHTFTSLPSGPGSLRENAPETTSLRAYAQVSTSEHCLQRELDQASTAGGCDRHRKAEEQHWEGSQHGRGKVTSESPRQSCQGARCQATSTSNTKVSRGAVTKARLQPARFSDCLQLSRKSKMLGFRAGNRAEKHSTKPGSPARHRMQLRLTKQQGWRPDPCASENHRDISSQYPVPKKRRGDEC